MLSETVVSTFLQASITGAGLVLAIYALFTPLSHRIFEERAKRLQRQIEKFEGLKNKITPDSKNKELKELQNLQKEIKETKIFPRYLGSGVFLTFVGYVVSVMSDGNWLASLNNRTPPNEFIIIMVFVFSTIGFLFVGALTIIEIYASMRREFEDVKKKQKEVKSTEVPKQESL
ncbi:MAG TPA: hypothetical protein VI864_05860 [Candidatus Bathyarchaeia archaeon]|nr:hypothetical protein [Candidatus Bathyarchaeia archaeon]